jgi:ATP-dependent Clp protease protease subunit
LKYDEIGAFGIGADEFSAALKALGTVSRITVSINSPGGEVFAGLSIYNMLKRHPAHITTRIDGVAASIASVIAMAGDEIIMPENAMMMIHNPAGAALGTSSDIREMADALDKISGSLVSSYASKTGLAREKIEAIMAAETWLTASEAVELGFADKIEKPVKIAAHFDLQARYGKAPSDQRAAQERQRAADITAACAVARQPAKAKTFIAEGKSVSDVIAILIAQQTRASGTHLSLAPVASAPKLHDRPPVEGSKDASWDKAIADIQAQADSGLVILK